jgi:prepilin-type N-terminal cleavage/methylation domain-containing protein
MTIRDNERHEKPVKVTGLAHGKVCDRTSAFTLIEVMMSVLIVGLMTLSAYAAFSYGFGVVQMTRDDLRATQILMQRAETIRLCTWSSLSNCPINFVTTYDPSGSSSAGTVYRGTITTNAVTGFPSGTLYTNNLRLLTASIFWTNTMGKQSIPHSRTMQTYIARYGIQNYVWGMP